MALEIPQSDRIYNQEPLPEGFNPDDPRQVNADWIMRIFDKIVNGEYAMKSFKTYSNFIDLPNTAEQGETAYVEEDAYKNSIFIYNGSSWTMAGGGGGSITIDSSLSTVSTNPVQNKVITSRINEVAAAIPIVDAVLSPTSTNTVQNKVVTKAIQGILPSQEDNEGRFLTTDGKELFWADINEGILNLFDIKTISEPTAQKGWSCISYPTQNKLSRDEVDEVYTYVRDKLNDCDKELDTLTTIEQNTATSKSLQCYQAGGNYVVFNDDNKLYKAEDINDSSTWTKINDYEINPNTVGFLEGETSCYNDNNNNIIIINNEDLATVKVLTSPIEIIPQFEFDGYFYGLANGDTYRWKDSLDADEIEIELVVAEFSFLSQTNNRLDKIYTMIDDYYYFNVYSLSGNVVCGCRAKDLSQPDNYEIMGYWNKAFVDYDFWKHRFLIYDNGVLTATTEETIINGDYGGHDVFEFTETSVFDNIDNIDLTEFTSLSVSNSNWSIYSFHWGVYILEFTNNNGTQKLFLRTDSNFENFTKLFDGTYTDRDGVTSVLYDENLLVVSDYMPSDDTSILGRLRTADAEKVVYTDTINGIDIKYYKNGDWKICTPDIAVGNDDNLQSVYEFLGYLNYWWIDEENEQITLQRDNRLWTMMYVGDDYEDAELPSGNYRKNKLVNELIEIDDASITIDVKGNQFYKFTNNAITDITIDSCDDSIEETTIQFTTGNSAPTLTDNSGLVWFGGIPTLLANTTYVIVIFNKQAFYQEN